MSRAASPSALSASAPSASSPAAASRRHGPSTTTPKPHTTSMGSTSMSASTSTLSALTALTQERKAVELQLTRMRQSLEAIMTDANINGVLQPDRDVTAETEEAMAAVRVMISALEEKRNDLTKRLEAVRHRHHQKASTDQAERERAILAEAQAAMQEHCTKAEGCLRSATEAAAERNRDHEAKVSSIFVANVVSHSTRIRGLQSKIEEQDRKVEERKRLRAEERRMRYEQYCAAERQRFSRLERLEELRNTHRTSHIFNASDDRVASSASAQKARRQSQEQPQPQTKAGRYATLPTLHASRSHGTSQATASPQPHTTTGSRSGGGMDDSTAGASKQHTKKDAYYSQLAQPAERGAELAAGLDAQDAQHLQNHILYERALVESCVAKREEREDRTETNKKRIDSEITARRHALTDRRKADRRRVEAMRQMQQDHCAALRQINGEHRSTAMARAQKQFHYAYHHLHATTGGRGDDSLDSDDHNASGAGSVKPSSDISTGVAGHGNKTNHSRWARRAQALIASVCTAVNQDSHLQK